MFRKRQCPALAQDTRLKGLSLSGAMGPALLGASVLGQRLALSAFLGAALWLCGPLLRNTCGADGQQAFSRRRCGEASFARGDMRTEEAADSHSRNACLWADMTHGLVLDAMNTPVFCLQALSSEVVSRVACTQTTLLLAGFVRAQSLWWPATRPSQPPRQQQQQQNTLRVGQALGPDHPAGWDSGSAAEAQHPKS